MKKILFLFVFSFWVVSFTTYKGNYDLANTNIEKSSKIILSPNPAKVFVRISCTDSALKLKKIAIYSILGDELLVNTLSYPNSKVDVNISKLKKGKYFVKALYIDNSEDMEQLIKI